MYVIIQNVRFNGNTDVAGIFPIGILPVLAIRASDFSHNPSKKATILKIL